MEYSISQIDERQKYDCCWDKEDFVSCSLLNGGVMAWKSSKQEATEDRVNIYHKTTMRVRELTKEKLGLS